MKQNLSVPSKVRAEHLNREALVYVRQSTMAQVRFNQESTQRQYALQERALSLGWPEEHIRVIDGDLGISGSGRSKRPGFAQLVTSVSLGEVGAVFGLEISRLARSSADLMKLLELCGLFGTLVIDEDGIYDMRLSQENTFLFGVKNKIYHPTKNGMATWFTGGIWYMAGKDIEVGEWDATKKCAVVTDDNLVDITKDLFVGTGIGNKRKILLCGSEMLSALSKINSEKFRLKDSVEVWNLKFKSWDTDFGEVLTIHHELFDANGMSDCGFAMDPEYLTKKTHVSWSRNILDLKKAGIRNTDAVVIQEVACLYLRYAKAHARMKLAQAPAA